MVVTSGLKWAEKRDRRGQRLSSFLALRNFEICIFARLRTMICVFVICVYVCWTVERETVSTHDPGIRFLIEFDRDDSNWRKGIRSIRLSVRDIVCICGVSFGRSSSPSEADLYRISSETSEVGTQGSRPGVIDIGDRGGHVERSIRCPLHRMVNKAHVSIGSSLTNMRTVTFLPHQLGFELSPSIRGQFPKRPSLSFPECFPLNLANSTLRAERERE